MARDLPLTCLSCGQLQVGGNGESGPSRCRRRQRSRMRGGARARINLSTRTGSMGRSSEMCKSVQENENYSVREAEAR